MMKKRYLTCWLLAIWLVIVFVLPVAAQPEDIVLDNGEFFGKKERPAVSFPHGMHMNFLECTDCHHRYEKGENVLDEDTLEEGNAAIRCGSCHNLNNRLGLQRAFHTSCTGCHRRMVGENGARGPRTCGGCHTKK
jgi:c(7)-type cytochrome triheme protein